MARGGQHGFRRRPVTRYRSRMRRDDWCPVRPRSGSPPGRSAATQPPVSQPHATGAREDRRILNLTAAARGTRDEPDTQVRQQAGLNRAIREREWGCSYKMVARDGQLIRIPAAYSSQECPRCGYTVFANRPTRERFGCQECGYEKMADVKAAETVAECGRREAESLASPSRLTSVVRPRHRVAACKGISAGLPMTKEPLHRSGESPGPSDVKTSCSRPATRGC